VKDPERLKDAPHPIIYHRLLDKDANKSGVVPPPRSFYEEAQALLFGGADTNGNTLMLGIFHLLENPKLVERMKDELHTVWPNLEKSPRFEDVEKLPFLVSRD
jgi:cytochrome P450